MAGLTREQKAALAAEAAAASAAPVLPVAPAGIVVTTEIKPDGPDLGEVVGDPLPPVGDETPLDVVAEDDGLVAVTKDGETLKVHPTCVADHKRLGWMEA